MQMEIFKLLVIFVMIMAMVLMKRQLRDAMIAAILLKVILLQIPIGKAAKMMVTSIYEKDTLLVLGYLVFVVILTGYYMLLGGIGIS